MLLLGFKSLPEWVYKSEIQVFDQIIAKMPMAMAMYHKDTRRIKNNREHAKKSREKRQIILKGLRSTKDLLKMEAKKLKEESDALDDELFYQTTNTLDSHPEEIDLGSQSNQIVDDIGLSYQDLVKIKNKELNLLLKRKGISKESKRSADIKCLRRKLKNRGYARTFQQKQDDEEKALMQENERLEQLISHRRMHVEMKRKELELLRINKANMC